MSIVESFSWFRDDLRVTNQVGNRVRIRGKAIHPTISGNRKEYLNEELRLAARSLANRPIDVNHEYDLWETRRQAAEEHGQAFTEPPPKFKGNVYDADYEDSWIEYVGEVNHPEYVEKLKDRQAIIEGCMTREAYRSKWGKDPICGVSVSAQFRPHQSTEKDGTVTPRGMSFLRLTLVEPPEKPGVQGTTLSLIETLSERSVEEARAVETLLRGVAPKAAEEYSREVIDKMIKESMAANPVSIPVWDAHRQAVFSAAPSGAAAPEGRTAEELARIGEPFAGYTDFRDCVEKNRDKENPEAYCGEVKKQAETKTNQKTGEKKEEQRPAEPAKETEGAIEEILSKAGEASKALEVEAQHRAEKAFDAAVREAILCAGGKIRQLNTNIEVVKTGAQTLIAETEQRLDGRILQATEAASKAIEGKASKEELQRVQETLQALPPAIDGLGKSFAALMESRDQASKKMEELTAEIKLLKERPQPDPQLAAKLTETEKALGDAVGKIKQLEEKIENLLTHVKLPKRSEEARIGETQRDTYPGTKNRAAG